MLICLWISRFNRQMRLSANNKTLENVESTIELSDATNQHQQSPAILQWLWSACPSAGDNFRMVADQDGWSWNENGMEKLLFAICCRIFISFGVFTLILFSNILISTEILRTMIKIIKSNSLCSKINQNAKLEFSQFFKLEFKNRWNFITSGLFWIIKPKNTRGRFEAS